MHKYISSLLVVFLFIRPMLIAQKSSFDGWFFSNHTQQLSKKWLFLSDIQLRSANQWKYLQTLLLRPGIQFKLSENHSVAAGYAYFGNWEIVDNTKVAELEHRIWEQYNLKLKLRSAELNARFRLEQRYIQGDDGFEFAQRMRYYMRMQLPFVHDTVFKHGVFLALQNELFLNVQNSQASNGKFFDQNRIYSGLGYRFNPKIALEAGYVYRFLIDKEKMHDHIFQVAIMTDY